MLDQPTWRKARILCVDDQPANLLALQAVFESSPDCELIGALSGADALGAARAQDFAVILLDVQMPEMDGFETANLLRGNDRSRGTPIIFLTAKYPEERHALQGYEVGAVDYLLKPLNIDVLRAKVAVFVDLFRARQEISQQPIPRCT